MCREVNTWAKWQLFPWEKLKYFPMKEVSPELRVINPEAARQLDCKGSAVGSSCGEQSHCAGHCMGNVLQDFRTGCHRGDLAEMFELKSLSAHQAACFAQLRPTCTLMAWMSFRQFCMATEERENRFKAAKEKGEKEGLTVNKIYIY